MKIIDVNNKRKKTIKRNQHEACREGFTHLVT